MGERTTGQPADGTFFDTKLPTLILLIVGVCLLAWTGWQVQALDAFLNTASRTTGVVVNERQHQRVRFATADGTQVEFVQNGFLDSPLGAPVPVAYDPRDPAGTARVDSVWATWVTTLWMLPAGLAFTLLPMFGVRAKWRAA